MFTKTNERLMLSDGAYAAGKKLVQVIIPAASSAYFALGTIWGLPGVEKVTGTLAVVAVFIGACLGFSSKSFDASGAAFDGQMVGHTDPSGKTTYTLEFHGDPQTIVNQETVSFKVVPGGSAPTT